jgi:hypothetical protein
MRTSVLLVSGLAALSQATPVLSGLVDLSKLNLSKDKGKHSKGDRGPFDFTSTYTVVATPDEVVDMNNTYTGGLEGASGVFRFGINTYYNTICYNITLEGFRGEYQSPALTATHIHEADEGKGGPPRLAFPNPTGPEGGIRVSLGCLTGPFKTGVVANGADTGDGFHVSEIEANPAAFAADVHSSLAVPGAVRGQLC